MKFKVGNRVWVKNFLEDGGRGATVIKQYGELELARDVNGDGGVTVELYQVMFNDTGLIAEVYNHDMVMLEDPNQLFKGVL